jgi:hypothetical protein
VDLESEAIADDRLAKRYLPRRKMYEAAAQAVSALKFPKVQLSATIQQGGLYIKATGRGDLKAALAKAQQVRDAAIDDWLAANGYTRIGEDGVGFDHARIVAERAPELRALADALAEGTTSERDFVERSLSFVQSIPYEARSKGRDDPGYRWPLSVLGANRGDCDSKTVLFLGILRSRLPSVPLSVVYVPGHALAGVGLPEERGDKTFDHEGIDYLYAEPVGPALLSLGGKVPGKHKARRGEVRPVPESG